MIVRELLTRLGFTVDEAGAAKYEKRTERIATNVSKHAAAAANVLLAVTKLAAVATTAIVAGVTKTAADLRELGSQADIAGASLDGFQRAVAAAGQVGFSADKIADVLKDVNDKVGEFLNTGAGPLKDFFETVAPQVGVTADAFRDLSGPDALLLFADTLERANLSAAEQTYYLEALANDATALAPLLADGAKEWNRLADAAGEFGFVTNAQRKAAERYMETMARMKRAFNALRYQLTETLAPIIETHINNLLDWYKANKAIVDQRIAWALRGIVDVFMALTRAGTLVASAVVGIINAIREIPGMGKLAAAAVIAFLAISPGGALLAGLGLLFLVLDDIKVWMDGGKSVMGDMFGSWESNAPLVERWIGRFKKLGGWIEKLNGGLSSGKGTSTGVSWLDDLGFEKTGGGIWGLVDWIDNTAIPAVERFGTSISTGISTAWTEAVDGIKTKWNDAMSGIETRWDNMVTWITDHIPEMPDWIKWLGSKAAGAAGSIGGLIDPSGGTGLTGPYQPSSFSRGAGNNSVVNDFSGMRLEVQAAPGMSRDEARSQGEAMGEGFESRVRGVLTTAMRGTLPSFPSTEAARMETV